MPAHQHLILIPTVLERIVDQIGKGAAQLLVLTQEAGVGFNTQLNGLVFDSREISRASS